MGLVWTPELAVGIPAIDQDHQRLLAAVGKLSEACAKGRGPDCLLETLEFLGHYASEHFAAEEALMAEIGYPGLAAHRDQHAKFSRDVERLRILARRMRSPAGLAEQAERMMCDWLAGHLRSFDLALGVFVADRQWEAEGASPEVPEEEITG